MMERQNVVCMAKREDTGFIVGYLENRNVTTCRFFVSTAIVEDNEMVEFVPTNI